MRLLGIEIGEREVRAAHGERILGSVRLTALERLPTDGPGGLAAALARLRARRPPVVLTALPAAAATHRVLVLPFRDRRRLAETVPLELLGHLPLEPEDAAVAFARLGPADGGTAVFAAVARGADVAAHVASLAAAWLPPARTDLAPLPAWNLVPAVLGDGALLLADGPRSTVSVRRAGRLSGLRALDARAGEPAALAAETRWALGALGGAPGALVLGGADAGPDLAAALGARLPAAIVSLAGAAGLPFPATDVAACAVAAGLVAGMCRRPAAGLAWPGGAATPPESLRTSAALAAAVVVLAVLDWGLVRHGLVRRDAALHDAIRAEAAAALPGARLTAPRAELEAAVAARSRRDPPGRGGAGALALLRELSTRVPPPLRLDLDEVALEPEGVRLHGRTESFDAVDALRRALAASPLLADVTAEETRTTVDGRRVEFRLRAARRTAPGAPS